jgi:putative methyltransferase (TIGR04325 family)
MSRAKNPYFDQSYVESHAIGKTRYSSADLISQSLLEVLKKIKSQEKYKKLRVLDVGCAYGDQYLIFKKVFKEIPIEFTGVDNSPEIVKAAKKKYPKNNFFVGDILDKYSGKKYDLVLASGLLPMIDDSKWGKVIENLCQMSLGYVIIHRTVISLTGRKVVNFHMDGYTFVHYVPSLDYFNNLISNREIFDYRLIDYYENNLNLLERIILRGLRTFQPGIKVGVNLSTTLKVKK